MVIVQCLKLMQSQVNVKLRREGPGLILELCLMTLHCLSTVFSGLNETCRFTNFIILCCFSCTRAVCVRHEDVIKDGISYVSLRSSVDGSVDSWCAFHCFVCIVYSPKRRYDERLSKRMCMNACLLLRYSFMYWYLLENSE